MAVGGEGGFVRFPLGTQGYLRFLSSVFWETPFFTEMDSLCSCFQNFSVKLRFWDSFRILGPTKEAAYIHNRIIQIVRIVDLVSFPREYGVLAMWKISFLTFVELFVFILAISRNSFCRFRWGLQGELSLILDQKGSYNPCILVSMLFHECYSLYGSVFYCSWNWSVWKLSYFKSIKQNLSLKQANWPGKMQINKYIQHKSQNATHSRFSLWWVFTICYLLEISLIFSRLN